MKKILLISNMYPNNKHKHYGAFVKNTYNILNEAGYSVDLNVLYKHQNSIVKLICYICFYLRTLFKCLFIKYDYLYIHFISHSCMFVPFIKKIKPNIKIVMNAHGNDVVIDSNKEYKNEIRSKRYMKYADTIIVPSTYFKEVIISKYRIKEEKIVIFPSGGVDTSLFKPMNKEKAKEKVKLEKNTKYIGYISRIEFNKGYDCFIKAINELVKKKNNNYCFLILGEGNETNNMAVLITKYHLSDYIIYKRMINQNELVDIYNSLDLFVFPTTRKSESLGLVGLEAMSCGVPVIAANNFGPASYIKDKENGILFKPNDYKELAKIIDNINDYDLDKIIKNGLNTVKQYDTKKVKKILIDVFK